MFAGFKGTNKEGYQEQSGGLLAGAAMIGSGMDLTPGDSIIMGDIDWTVQTMQQVGARVRRATLTQLARFTHSHKNLTNARTVLLTELFGNDFESYFYMTENVGIESHVDQSILNLEKNKL